MWPWEHAAVGYACYSLGVRLTRGRAPAGDPVLFLAVGTQFPDLVDKPLSWGLGAFPTGYAVGHSVLVMLPITVVLLAYAERRRRAWLPAIVAFLVGAWTHLAGDVVSPLRDGDSLGVDRVLWPIVAQEPYAEDLGLGRGLAYLGEYVAELGQREPAALLGGPLGLALAAVVLWVVDGTPGVNALVGRARGLARRIHDVA